VNETATATYQHDNKDTMEDSRYLVNSRWQMSCWVWNG